MAQNIYILLASKWFGGSKMAQNIYILSKQIYFWLTGTHEDIFFLVIWWKNRKKRTKKEAHSIFSFSSVWLCNRILHFSLVFLNPQWDSLSRAAFWVAALAEGFVTAGLWERICFEFEAGALDFYKRSEEDKCIVVNS